MESIRKKIISWMKKENSNIKSKEFCKKYKISSKTLSKYFASYQVLKELAGHEYIRKEKMYSDEDLLERIKDFYKAHSRPPAFSELPGASHIAERIGWNIAIEKALGIKRNYTKEEIEEEFIRIKKFLNKAPSSNEFLANSQINIHAIKNIFGTWNEFKRHMKTEALEMHEVKSNEDIKALYLSLSRRLEKKNGATKEEWTQNTKYSAKVLNRFGGINELRKECGFEPIQKKYVWHKEDLEKILYAEYLKKGATLTQADINKNDDLPYTTTVLRVFKTTKLTEVWVEVLKKNSV